MHSIKKAARRSAWYSGDDDEYKTYNPFGRATTNKPKKRDVEAGGRTLTHRTSENDAGPSPMETQRHMDFGAEEDNIHGVEKSGTYPPGPSGGIPRRSAEDKAVEMNETSESNGSASKKGSSDQEGTVETAVGGNNGDGKMRKRRKFMPWKKSENNELGHDQSEKDDSKPSRIKKFPPVPVMQQFKAVFFSWINILLIAVPVGIALEYTKVNKIAVFVVNFIAIIPLAAVLSFSTEELALYVGEVLGGLLNATFGNAVELIVSIIALIQHKILIVQTSLIGSMLSNLLLVLGMCFFFGGLRREEQFFNLTVAQTAASLLALAIGSLIIPTAFKQFADNDNGVVPTSRGTAVLLLVTYACYLLFQLRTHVDMYNEKSQKAAKKPRSKHAEALKRRFGGGDKEDVNVRRSIAQIGGDQAQAGGAQVQRENYEAQQSEEEEETPQLSIIGALITLAVSTVFVALCAEFMVSAINDVASSGVSEEFIGLILLPIVGNAAEHATAVTVAIKDKMDLSIGVACGSSLQIALLVLPFMVLLNWWGVGLLHPGDPQYINIEQSIMTLSFDGFQVSVLFIAIIVVNYVIQDGKSHWLEGVLLQIIYLIIAVSAWFYPAKGDVAG